MNEHEEIQELEESINIHRRNHVCLEYSEIKELLNFFSNQFVSYEVGSQYNGEVVHAILNRFKEYDKYINNRS